MKFLTLILTLAVSSTASAQKKSNRFEGELAPFLGKAKHDKQQVFKGSRFPNIAVATDGTLLAVFGKGGVSVRRSPLDSKQATAIASTRSRGDHP